MKKIPDMPIGETDVLSEEALKRREAEEAEAELTRDTLLQEPTRRGKGRLRPGEEPLPDLGSRISHNIRY